MRTIYKIAKTELQLLFYSPIAWLLLLCFVVQTGSLFTGIYGGFVSKMAERGMVFGASRDLFITHQGMKGLWMVVQGFLYFYIPLLTMGVISKEFSGGTIKLLYSSPISNTQIVLGKFLAMALYGLLFMFILLVYAIYAWLTIENCEIAWILTGWLGLVFLIWTYMAVGIFVSSLTTYQIIAAVGTFVILMLLSAVGGLWQQYDFIRDITYWLSIDGRTNTFIQGMLCSEDVIYFPVIIAMFLALTIIRLNAVRQKQRFLVTCRKNLIVIGLVCVAAWFSSRPALMGYCDTTLTQKNTLTPNSQEVINKLDGDVTVTAYANVLSPHYCMFTYPHFIMMNRNRFEQYTRFKPEMKLKVVYYWDEVERYREEGRYKQKSARQQMREFCEQSGLDSNWLKTPEEIKQMVDLSEEGHGFVYQIVRENGQKEWLRMYGGMSPQEAEITAAFKRLVTQLPTVGFVTGHGERSLHSDDMSGYSMISDRHQQYSLWNQGFDIQDVSLEERVPDEVTILVIADMQREFSPEEEKNLRAYLDRGDNLMILGEPRRRDVVNPLLREYFGVELTPLVAGIDEFFGGKMTPNSLACVPTKEARKAMYQIGGTYRVVMPTCAGVEQVEDKGFDWHVFIRCDTVGQFWTELETTDFVDDTIRFNPAIGEVSKVFTTMAGLTRQVNGKEQRIVITGDADMFSNDGFRTTHAVSALNHLVMLGCGNWLSYGEAPIDVRRPLQSDNVVHLSADAYRVTRWAMKWGAPILIVGMALFLWLRRRGR